MIGKGLRRKAIALLGILVGLAGTSGTGNAVTHVGGEIAGTETWTKDGNPYVATADITVLPGASLRIEPGVEVRFKRDINDRHGKNWFDLEILVQGSLTVRGAPEDTVILASAAPEPRWTDWQGIVVVGKDARADLAMVRISDANTGVKAMQGGTVIARGVTMKHCGYEGMAFLGGTGDLDDVTMVRIAQPSGSSWGIRVDTKSNVVLRNSSLVDTRNGMLVTGGSTARVERTMITLNDGVGISIGESNLTVLGCSISVNRVGVMWTGGPSVAFHYNNLFENADFDLLVRGYQGDPVELDFTNNWWGLTNLSLIEDRVKDATDDPTLGATVRLEPFLTKAVAPADSIPEAK